MKHVSVNHLSKFTLTTLTLGGSLRLEGSSIMCLDRGALETLASLPFTTLCRGEAFLTILPEILVLLLSSSNITLFSKLHLCRKFRKKYTFYEISEKSKYKICLQVKIFRVVISSDFFCFGLVYHEDGFP